MMKSCPRCGKIHDVNYKCTAGIGQSYNKEQTSEQRFRSSAEWRSKSIQIRSDARYLCEVCLKEKRFTYQNLSVHHIIPLKEDASLGLDDSNLICLCQKHHEEAEMGLISRDELKKIAEKRIRRSE